MQTLSRNIFKKFIVILLVFAFVSVSIATSSVDAYAAETHTEEISSDAITRSRVILTSGSVVNKRGTYTSSTFTTNVATSLHHGMSYYISCSSASTTFDIKVYKSNGNYYTMQALSANNPYASAVFYLEGNTSYYFEVIPSDNATYDFSYNIYYNK